ncbi:MAG: hypothetical protein P8H25_05065 [Flavobacteriaceae bacterium]|nr:hypothetical protein [Flavobacteriaceae bacterium]
MKTKTINILSLLAAIGMIGGGISAIYNEDHLVIAIGIYFIAKGLFVFSLVKSLQKKCCDCCSTK